MNRTLCRRLGYVASDLLGQPVSTLYHPSSSARAAEVFEGFRESEVVHNERLNLEHADGHAVPVLLNASALADAEGRVTHTRCAFTDIGELVALEGRNAAMLLGALDGVVTMDHEGLVLEYNPAAARIFGYAASEAIGKPLASLIIPEALRESHRQGLERYLRTKKPRVLARRQELSAQRKSGEHFPIELSIIELEVFSPPLFTGFIRDLTELKRAQTALERTVSDLQRSNRDLEQFAYIASHDLQEPLRMVTAYMDLVNERYNDLLDDKGRKFIFYAVDGARRLKKLIDDLLQFSRVGSRDHEPEYCELEEIVEGVEKSLALRLSENNGRIVREKLPAVWGDRAQLEQLLGNLVTNAMKFRTESPPQVTISATHDDSSWTIVVADNGMGFDSIHAERIFQMFQRLQSAEHHSGTGIGLAIARRIVERHGGRVWAESQPGQGAQFIFTLPIERPQRRSFNP